VINVCVCVCVCVRACVFFAAAVTVMFKSGNATAAMQVPSAENQDRDEVFGRSRIDARKQFEESLRKVTKRVGDSPELMNLLLSTDRPAHPSNDGMESVTASSRGDVTHDVHATIANSTVPSVTSTDEHNVVDHSQAFVDDDRTSVFAYDKLDEYLAADRMEGNLSGVPQLENETMDVDLDVEFINALQTGSEKPDDSVAVSGSWSPRKDERMQSARNSEVEVDIIDSLCFYSFSTPEALTLYADSACAWKKTGVDDARTKKFQYGFSGNMPKYLAKAKGWERRISVAGCDDLDALLSDGMVRKLDGDVVVPGVNVTDVADEGAVTPGCDGGRAVLGRYPRRGIGKMGDEERQPRKGRIYGRKFDGRFASKANIHYHFKRRRSPTSAPYRAVVTSQGHVTSGQTDSDSRQFVSFLPSPNLQPHIALTRAVVSVKPSLVAKDRKPLSGRPISYNKNQSVVQTSGRIRLMRVTESIARRAIVALQLAPSMTNSPMKCSQPGLLRAVLLFRFS